ncbi:MAG: hypothetical protein WCR42_12540 [bacterium]
MILLAIDLTIFIYVIFIVGSILLFSIPPFLAFLLYKWLKKKGKTPKIIGLSLFFGVCGFMIWGIYQVITGPSGFGPEYDKAEIKQKIGGTLICSSVYSADIHSGEEDVKYKYKAVNDSIYELGTGCYESANWAKNEQLEKFGKWLILKTSNSRDSDKLIIGKLGCKTWSEYVFSPQSIEKNKMWRAKKINSTAHNWDSYSKIEKISSDGIIILKYHFVKGNYKFPYPFPYGKRYIKYKIDSETGTPEMVKIYK